MKLGELRRGLVCAVSRSVTYVPEEVRPAVVVDVRPWVLESTSPRRLRRPRTGERRYQGEMDQDYPTAFLGIWVIIGSEFELARGRLEVAAERARKLVPAAGGPEPSLPAGLELTSNVVMVRQLHMTWSEHLAKLSAVS